MQEYVASWEQMEMQLASKDAPVDEKILVTMSVECFLGLVEITVRNCSLCAANERRLHIANGHLMAVTIVWVATMYNTDGRVVFGQDVFCSAKRQYGRGSG